jgi:hypothetical protein
MQSIKIQEFEVISVGEKQRKMNKIENQHYDDRTIRSNLRCLLECSGTLGSGSVPEYGVYVLEYSGIV